VTAATTTPHLVVDWTRCDGHGLCHSLAPELVGRDEWGFPVLHDRPAGAPADLRRIAAACPALALRLEPR
jgi:ferredoxin